MPITVIAECFIHNDLLIFATSAIALIPLAGVLGEATEELALHYGPKNRWPAQCISFFDIQ